VAWGEAGGLLSLKEGADIQGETATHSWVFRDINPTYYLHKGREGK